jgi:hypothetical protein
MDSEKGRTAASVWTLPIILKEKINCFDLIHIQMSSAHRASSTICWQQLKVSTTEAA